VLTAAVHLPGEPPHMSCAMSWNACRRRVRQRKRGQGAGGEGVACTCCAACCSATCDCCSWAHSIDLEERCATTECMLSMAALNTVKLSACAACSCFLNTLATLWAPRLREPSARPAAPAPTSRAEGASLPDNLLKKERMCDGSG